MPLKLFVFSCSLVAVTTLLLLNRPRSPGFAVPLTGEFTARAPSPRPDMPPIDTDVTTRVETATFAMG